MATTISEATVRRRAVASGFVGTFIEYYDYLIYGTAAALVFSQVFFPKLSSAAGTLAALATFGVAFVARPLGGVVFGHLGDRIGRKATLIATIVTMGVGTFLIGCLPTYGQIGILAPIFLVALRLLQGVSAGGEWGGAVLVAVEHAPAHRRGRYGGWPQAGIPASLIASSGVMALMSALLTDEAFLSWGWRVPFWLSAPLVAFGLYIRLRVTEPEEFARAKETGTRHRFPAKEVLSTSPALLGLTLLAQPALWIGFYLYSVYGLSYAEQVGVSSATTLTALMVAAAADTVAMLFFADLSDRVGRLPIWLIGSAFVGILGLPFFLLVNTGSALGVIVALTLVLVLGHGTIYGVQSSMFSELFEVRSRYSALSISYQFGALLFGAPAPLLAGYLVQTFDSFIPLVILLAVVALVSVVGTLLLAHHLRPRSGEAEARTASGNESNTNLMSPDAPDAPDARVMPTGTKKRSI